MAVILMQHTLGYLQYFGRPTMQGLLIIAVYMLDPTHLNTF